MDGYIFDSPLFPWTGKRTTRAEVAEVFATLFSYFIPGKETFGETLRSRSVIIVGLFLSASEMEHLVLKIFY